MDEADAMPQHMREFNEIASAVLARLYDAFRLEKTIDPAEIAVAMGVAPTGTLPSGRPFEEVFEAAMRRLHTQGFTNTYGSHARERATLTARSLYAMNVVPPALQGPRDIVSLPQATTGTTGTAVVEATDQAAQGKRKQLVDLAGSFIGSMIRSTLGS
jgi:hypothetical protein